MAIEKLAKRQTNTDQTYLAPQMFAAGKAVDLVQGSGGTAYKDSCNGWYENYTKPSHCG